MVEVVENSGAWASWMTVLGLLAVLLIFGSAWYWVNSIRRGNRIFRFWQKRHPDSDSSPEDRSYPGQDRDDLR